MELGPLTKLDKRIKATSKKFDDDFMLEHYGVIVIFRILTNLEQSESRIPDTES